MCHLTTRQRRLYQAVRNKISIDDLVYTSTSSSSTNATTSSLMNLVMQFRKVSWFWHFLSLSCSHPAPLKCRARRTTSYTILLTRSLPGAMIKPCNVVKLLSKCIYVSEPASFWRENLDSRECRSGKNQSEVLVCDRKRVRPSSMKISVLTFLVKKVTMKHSVVSNCWEIRDKTWS